MTRDGFAAAVDKPEFRGTDHTRRFLGAVSAGAALVTLTARSAAGLRGAPGYRRRAGARAGQGFPLASRPSPPTIKVNTCQVRPGVYVFVSPKKAPGERAPSGCTNVVDDNGERCGFARCKTRRRRRSASRFKVQGEPVLTWWLGYTPATGRASSRSRTAPTGR